MSYSHLDDLPWSIRQSRLRTLEASPNPSHFSLVSNSPEVPPHQQQVMSPNSAPALPDNTHATEQQHQQQQQQQDACILIRSLSQISIPEQILTGLQHLASINLGGIQDLEAVMRATETLAFEVSSRTERLATGVQAVATMASGIRDGAVVLEQRARDTAEAQVQDRQTLQSVQRSLQTLEVTTENKNISVDRRVEILETMVLKLQGELQQVTMPSGSHPEHQAGAGTTDTKSAESEHLPAERSTPDGAEELASLRAQVEQLGDSVSSTTAKLKDDDKRLRTVLHRLDELEAVSARLRQKSAEIEQAMEERFRLMTSGVPPLAGTTSEGPKHPKSTEPGPSVVESQRKGTEWHQMSPDVGDQPGGDDLGWYNDEWPEPTRWPQPGWQLEPPGLGAAAAVKPTLEKVHPGNWKLLKDCPVLKMTQGEPWELGLALRQWENETSSIASAVAGSFGQFFRARMQQALERYQRRQATSVEEPVPLIPAEEREFETRLGVMFIKNLPTTIRQPVMERHQGAEHLVSTLLLLEAVMERFSPGGTAEMTSLLQFQRALPTAGTFKELLSTIRRFELAKGRSEYLKLPPIASHETIRSLEGLTKNLEKKHPALAMRLNLIRLTPEVVVPSEAGVQRLLTTLVQEGRRMQAEDEVTRNRKGHEALAEDTQGAAVYQAKGSGKGAKGTKGDKGARDTSKIPCGYFQLERGCLKGDACPYLHSTSKGGKGKGKGQSQGKKGSEDPRTVAAEAKAKAKSEAKAKKKAEAKAKAAAATTEAKMALVGSGAVAASAAAMVKSVRGVDADESGLSELSSMGRSEPGSDAPTSSLGSPEEASSEEEQGLPRRPSGAPRLWYLVLTPAEFVYWSRPRQVICRAAREFEESTRPNDVARGLWFLFQDLDFDFPIQGEQIGPGQFVVSAREVLCEHADNIIRPVVLVHILDSDTGREQMLALANHQVSPRVRPWRQFQAPLGIMRPLREAAADLRGILAQEETVFGPRGYAERFGDPDPDGFPPARAPTVPMPPSTSRSSAEQANQNPGTAAVQTNQNPGTASVQTDQNPGMASASQMGQGTETVRATVWDVDTPSSQGSSGDYAAASMAIATGAKGPNANALVLVDNTIRMAMVPFLLMSRLYGRTTSFAPEASGEVVGGFRTRDGEVVLRSGSSTAESDGPESSGDWILGVMRVIEVGGAFHWTNQGATLAFPDQGSLRKVQCQVRNGLPCITWRDFAVLRKVLSRHWKSSDGRIRVARAMVKHELVENLFISQEALEAAEFETRVCEMFAEVAYEHVVKKILEKDMIDKAIFRKRWIWQL